MRSMQHEINNDFELMKEEVKKTSKRLEKKKPFCSMPVSSRKKKKGKKEKEKKKREKRENYGKECVRRASSVHKLKYRSIHSHFTLSAFHLHSTE